MQAILGKELFEKIHAVIPEAEFLLDIQGQLMIYTNLYSNKESDQVWGDRTWQSKD